MRNIIIIFLILTSLFITSCEYLDEEPLYYQTAEDKFIEEQKVEFALNMCYGYLPKGYFNVSGSMLAAATDDAVFNKEDWGINRIARAQISPSNPIYYNWSECYRGINQTFLVEENLHLMNIPKDKKITDPIAYFENKKTEFLAETQMLRAFFYFELFKMYGGVPLVKERMSLADNPQKLGRANVKEIVDYIAELCDSAYSQHPNTIHPIRGRWGKGAALAIKAKTLAYAASDLFNVDIEHEYLGYVDGNQKERQEKAAKALSEVINMGVFSLYSSYNMFNQDPSIGNTEYVVYRGLPQSSSIERKLYPPSFGGYGTIYPTQDFVDAFDNADGSEYITAGSMDANQWNNRDPRLQQIILHDSSELRTGEYVVTSRGEDETQDGIGVVFEKSTTTGYYLKKFTNSIIDYNKDNPGSTYHIWPLIRYADILLLYAEMMNEAYGPNIDNGYGLTAIQAVELVRERAMLAPYSIDPNISGEGLISLIKKERRIELCFEDQRYFDLRRWKDAENALNKEVHGVDIVMANGVKTYKKVVVDGERKFDAKMYLAPIPYWEVQVLSIPQNPLW